MNAKRQPEILVYRRTERVPIYADDPKFDDTREQYRKAQAFFDRFKNPDGSYPGGFTDYATPTDFVSRLKKDLKTMLRKRLEAEPSPPPGVVVEPVWTGSPYPGLRPFDVTEVDIFFGRGRETDALIAQLRDPNQRFLAVVGASGSGKSSLVRAGLLPRLQQGAIEGSRHWRVLTLTPGAAGGNPFLALAFELARELPPSTRKPAIKIAEELAEEPQRITEYATTLLAGRPAGAALVLFVDQMEELFTTVAKAHQTAFLDLLAHAAGDPWLRVLATLRADFLSQAVAEPTLQPLLQAPAGTYLLAPPDPLALAEMIRRPTERAGLDIEDDMVREVLKDAGTDPGALPLVAFCLD